MEDFVGRDWESARRCVEAMAGQDEDTRRALERAAGRYALKHLGFTVDEQAGVISSPACSHTSAGEAGV